MRFLILVKHSLPAIVPAVPAAEWRLSAEGRRRCAALAERLVPWRPTRLVASEEPKAAETAALVAGHLGLPWEMAAGLHEHERRTVPFAGEAEFRAAVAALFAQPEHLVYGEETAAGARTRFAAAVDALLARYPDATLAVVAHGTVISLYATARAGVDSYALWRRLGLPAFVVLSQPDGRIMSVLETIDAPAE
jgi:broad specificity phosphatase PhoE